MRTTLYTTYTFWAADFTFLKTRLEVYPQTKIKMLLVYDLGNGEIVGAKIFNFNKNKKTGISSLYVSKFLKKLFIKYNIIEQKHLLMLHTDRGTEFLSKEYLSLKDTFPIKFSMTDAYKPKQNAVIERLNKTIKNQVRYIKPLIPASTTTIQKLQTVVNKRITNFNQDFKAKRNLNLGATKLRELFNTTQEPLPSTVLTYTPQKDTTWANSDADILQEYRQKVKFNFQYNDDEFEFLKNKIEHVLKEMKSQQDRIELNQHLSAIIDKKNHQQLMDFIIQIDKKVSKPKKKKHQPKLLREPITKNIFYQLMQLPKAPNKRYSSYCRFKLVTVILYFTGMRLSEVGNLNIVQLRELQTQFKTQICAKKQNKMIYIVVPTQIGDMLHAIEDEIETTFYDSYQKHQQQIIKHTFDAHTFVIWYNRQLKIYLTILSENNNSNILQQNIQQLSSHSFRINRITQLLRQHIPIEKVQRIIGHANIQTTSQYFRWKPGSAQTIKELSNLENQDEKIDFSD